MNTAVYAGTFDPVTNGHLWMIRTGARLFGHLVVAIGINPDKVPTFSLDERLSFIRDAIPDLINAGTVTLTCYEGLYLSDYARSIGVPFILRGIRGDADFGYEQVMRHVNAELAADVETVFLMPPKMLAETSSSLVRGLVGPAGWRDAVSRYVPPSILEAFVRRHAVKRFVTLSGRLKASWPAADLGARLVADWSDRGRHYHTANHLIDCLERVDELVRSSEDGRLNQDQRNLVELALFFHDRILDTSDPASRTGDQVSNEERSALSLEHEADPHLDPSIVSEAVRLVRLTERHDPADEDYPGQVMCDCDLAILGADPERFDRYEADVRQEYAWVSDENWRTGRRAVVEKFLDRQTLFRTPYFQKRFENQARENLRRSIQKLV